MIWKQWKKPKTKVKKLIQLGVQPYKAYEWGIRGNHIGESLKVPYYIKPLATLIGVAKGKKACTVNMAKSVIYLIEPPFTEPYVRWCERTEVSHLLLLDL